MTTTVVNLLTDGFPPGGVYIGRAGHGQSGYFGNPFKVGLDGDRDRVLELYKMYFERRLGRDPEFKERIEALKGKTLICFCVPKPCHGQIIAEYLNEEAPDAP